MSDIPFLQKKLAEAPAGFGFADIGQWLQDVPHIAQLASIKPLFFESLSTKAWLAFLVLLKQRYIQEGPASNLFDDHFEAFVEQNGLQDFYKRLAFYEDDSKQIDLSPCHALQKIIISASRQLTNIKLPVVSQLEALSLSYLPLLSEVEHIEASQDLLYLVINHCPQLACFDFIRSLAQLVYLDLSNNEQLVALDFLPDDSQVVILQLLATPVLNHPNSLEHLKKLKYLKFLNIEGKQPEIATLRKELPHCVINGMTAFTNLLD